MKIVLSVDVTQGGMRGGDVYAHELARALARIDSVNEYLLFGFFFRQVRQRTESIPCPSQPNFKRLIKRWPQALVGKLEGQWGVPWIETYLRTQGVDLYHAPGPWLPRLRRIRSVVSVHDLIPYSHPEMVPSEGLEVSRTRSADAVRRATLILASSTATKLDLMRHLNVPEEKIRVIILGVNAEVFKVIDDLPFLESIRKKFSLPKRFILSAGPYEPRRNWEGILSALQRLNIGDDSIGAVFTGSLLPAVEKRLDALIAELGLSARVAKVGHVSKSDLVTLYNLAEAFVYPSFYDGFNLPILESMACGTPVVASGAGALAEIAGGASCLVDPKDPDSIADGIRETLEPSRRAELREKGFQRARELTWDRVARATLQAYQDALRA